MEVGIQYGNLGKMLAEMAASARTAYHSLERGHQSRANGEYVHCP